MKSFGEHLELTRKYEEEISQFSYITRDTHRIVELGSVDGDTIYLFEATESDGTMVTSGWQGDEPAGWETAKRLAVKFARTSFIPYVSPACFKTGEHRNYYGKNVDRGYPEATTGESKILLANLDRISSLSQKLFLSLQEDAKRFVPYYYSWATPVEIEEIIETTIKRHFPLTEQLKYTAHEGMFGGFIVESGAQMAVQLETPADGSYTIARRVDCLFDGSNRLLNAVAD